MVYTIGQVSDKMGITTYTLRYYDRQGILPFVKRTESGIRIFDDNDLEFIHVIHCLKGTGMSIIEIRKFIELASGGDSTLKARYELFEERRKEVEKQIKILKKYEECILFKCNYYKKILESGREEAVFFSEDEELSLSKIVGISFKEEHK